MADHNGETPAISESASKKRKRGRPKVMSPEMQKLTDFLSPDVRTQRGKQNVYYRNLASSILYEDKRFSWLADGDKMEAGIIGSWKPGILSELGRIIDLDDMKAVALRLCELKPKTKEAIAMIRGFRLGRTTKPDYMKLLIHLENSYNAYVRLHPDTPAEWCARAFRDLADMYQDDTEA